MKNKLLLFAAGCCILFMSSCLGSDEDTEYTISKDCEILTFYLSNDSIDGLSDVIFTIDQVSGRIYNADSMPYGTIIDEKVLCNMTLASTVYKTQAIEYATGDTIVWESSEDSIDFSKPVQFINTLWDGTTTKLYLAQINIHQVVPDSMVWSMFKSDVVGQTIKNEKVVVMPENNEDYFYMYVEPATGATQYALYTSSALNGKDWSEKQISGLPYGKINLSQMTKFQNVLYVSSSDGELYSSTDGLSWGIVNGTPTIKALLGALNAKDDYTASGRQSSALSVISSNDGTLKYAAMMTDGTWKEGETIDDNFPLDGFASVAYDQMYRERLMLVCGKTKNEKLVNTTWSTEDGYKWNQISNDGFDRFDAMEGVSVTKYDGGFFMVGGLKADGTTSKDIYTSIDGGISWAVSDTLVLMPEDFVARGYMSVQVNEEKYMYLFGGKQSTNSSVDDVIWRGRINRLGFPDND